VTNNRFRFFTVFLLAFCFYCLSQPDERSLRKRLYEQYLVADVLYNKALHVSSSPHYDEALETSLNEKALQAFENIATQLPVARSIYDSLAFFVHFKTGELHHYFERPENALNYYKHSIQIKSKTKTLTDDSLLFKPYLFSGIIYYNRNHFDSALYFFQQAEKIKQLYAVKLSDEERLYNNLGALHYATGNLKQARNYFQKAADVLPKDHPYYKDLLVNYYINLASALTIMEQYDAANEIYERILVYGSTTDVIKHNIGVINLNLGSAKKALNYFRQVEYQTNRIVALYNDMGTAFINLSRYDSAEYYLQKAITENKKWNKQNPNVAHGITLKNLADLRKRTSLQQALEYYQRAIHQFYPSYTNNDVKQNPGSFSGIFSYIQLFNTLTAKADAFHQLYVQTKKIDWAKLELQTFQSAYKLVDYVERSYDSDEARLFLNKIKYFVHHQPIDIAFDLYTKTKEQHYLESAFFFDQKNKASVLSFNQYLDEHARIQDTSVVKKERTLRTQITRLSLQATKTADVSALSKINASIREAEIELGRIQEQMAASVNAAFNSLPGVKELQKQVLDNQNCLVSYHLSDSHLIIFLLTKNFFTGYKKHLPATFYDTLSKAVQSFSNGEKVHDLASKQLHQLLFSEVVASNKSSVIIIPDDELNYLPFDALKNTDGKYFIEDHSVQYQYSTAFLRQENFSFKKASSIGFAPFAQSSYKDSNLALQKLPFSLNEITQTIEEKKIGNSATKAELLKTIQHYSVIHLATHAQINSKEPDLSFIALSPSQSQSDYLLYAKEIYDLELNNTDLVILSACETGAGNLEKGEGVMSLSRAFSYAGCPNIITSLWKADDESTAYIINRFYSYLEDGASINTALQQAKKDYLRDAKVHPRKKHPFYWAHLVFIGNYPKEESNAWWMWFIPVVAILAFMITRKSRRPKRDLVNS
jgi:CHAT domain-containing protein